MATGVLQEQRFTTRKLHPTFGLEISGLDITGPLGADTIATLIDLTGAYKLLVFKDQAISPESLTRFARHFGDTNQVPPKISAGAGQARKDDVSRFGDQKDSDEPDADLKGYNALSRHWHTDSSWRPIPTWLTFLAAAELPDTDGRTGFADMQAAYDTLPEAQKTFLANKHIIHSWRTMRRYEPGIPPMGDDDNVPPPSTHPVVRTVDGRKGLFLNGQVAYYVGNMPLAEGEALFGELMVHATAPAFVYEHVWTIGDVAMWDDRTTMHRAMPYDARQRRVMYRAEVVGTEAPQ